MYVQLTSAIDEYRYNYMSFNEKIEELNKPDTNVFVQIESLKEASELVRKFVKKFNLTSSNFTGGEIVDENFNFMARISYNGRAWDNKDYKKSKEIIL